ncbi:MAG: YkgJ family cysteine cluster protein [Halanaerobiales bacterium]
MSKFNCTMCGVCCTKLNRNELYKDLDRGDGICIFLNLDSKLCTIYDDRPLLCNIDKMYKEYFYKFYSQDEYYNLNKKGCNKLKGN